MAQPRYRQSQRKSMETEQTQAPDMVDQADNHEKKSPQESFAELRKAKEDLERQLWQAQKEKELFERQMQMQSQHSQQPSLPVEEDFDFRQLENEDFPDGKKLAKAFNQVNKKLSGYEQKLAEKEQKIMFLETAQSLEDFNKVVTAENIEKYIKSDEDNREAVEKAANPLRKAYNLIKKDARFQADMAAKNAPSKPISQEQQRVNSKEGMPSHGSIGVRSGAVTAAAVMSNSKMSREQKQALWKETIAAARK